MKIRKLPSGNVPMEVDTNVFKLGPDRMSNSSSGTSVLDQEQSAVDDPNLCSTSSFCAAPICRQFWKAGVYTDNLNPKFPTQSGSSYLHVHPRFLHSNATSHKWVFGAVAELIDNAVDEIQNGARFVIIDKIVNPRNGSSALLIHDDGSGMDPEAMRRCLSFGFSEKKSISSIGKYGNGFKTSSMRLGADVIVFSSNTTNSKVTKSIGLLSYTFLTRMCYDKIVVPMVHYDFDLTTRSCNSMQSKRDVNLSLLLQWSPFSTEKELLQQFEDVGDHGTKVIIYNLWLDEDGNLELDFESDSKDICITRDAHGKMKEGSRPEKNEQHIANRLHYSLRAYLSILYLKLPETFAMILRGKVVLYENVARDLKYTEFIKYKPHKAAVEVVTTIGFTKDAPHVNVHGFNVYHKNRLILPFWPAVNFSANRGRGVVGVLEANFIEPTHNKQEFEKTSLFLKLAHRLKEMTIEYWNCHCGLIGYQFKKKRKPSSSTSVAFNYSHHHGTQQPIPMKNRYSVVGMNKNKPTGKAMYTKVILEPRSMSKPVQQSIPSGPPKEQPIHMTRSSSRTGTGINRPMMTPEELNPVSKPEPTGVQEEQPTPMSKSSSDADMIRNRPMESTIHSKVTIDSNSMSEPVEPSFSRAVQEEQQPTPVSESSSDDDDTITKEPMVTTVQSKVAVESNSMSTPIDTTFPEEAREEQPFPMMNSPSATGTTIHSPIMTPVISKVTLDSDSMSKPFEPSTPTTPKGFQSEQETAQMDISSHDAGTMRDEPIVTTLHSNAALESNSMSTPVETIFPEDSQEGSNLKRKASDQTVILISDDESEDDSDEESNVPISASYQKAMEENKNLKARWSENLKTEEQLNLEVKRLKLELEEAQREYVRLLDEMINETVSEGGIVIDV